MSKRLQKRALHLGPREPRPLTARPGVRIESLESRIHLSAHVRVANIGGAIFNDLKGNGKRTAKDHWLPGVAVYLDLNNNGVQDPGEPATVTNKKGVFLFRKVPRGIYTVVALSPAGDVATVPLNGVKSVNISKHSVTSLRFGEKAAPPAPPVVVSPAPPAGELNAPAITTSGFTPYRFTVTWTDASGVEVSSFGDGNFVVTGINGFNEPADLVALDSVTNGSPRTATYQIPAPSTGWTVNTDGVYTINLVGGQIADTAGNIDPASALGTFDVAISNAGTAAPMLIGGVDGITADNNSSPSSALTFTITGATDGAQLMLEADGTPLGSTSAGNGSTNISTDGYTTLTDGPHQFTVLQILGNGVQAISPPTNITVDTTGPMDSLQASPITAGGGATDTFNITYTDATQVSVASIAGGNLQVSTPGGQHITPSLASISPNADSPTCVATYQFNAPGGVWTAADNGTYTVTLLAHQVSDIVGNDASGRVVGTFAVSIGKPLSPVTGVPALSPASDTGASNSDDLTDLNNRSSATALQFSVPGVQNGAVVTIYSDGTPIGSATASGTTATVSTNGSLALSNGAHQITATQIAPGEGPSDASTPLGIVIDTKPPTAASSPPPVNAFGAASYSFSVIYTDNMAVDSASLASGNVVVTGPNGFSEQATLQSVNAPGNGSPLAATYSITPPGGSWSSSDNGTYTLNLGTNQVFDTAGNAAAAGAIAMFMVNAGLVSSPTPAAPTLLSSSDTGESNGDGLTNLNNASPGSTLQFSVASTIPGATVSIYSDGTLIGSAVAASASTIVTTDGNTKLVHGPHTITARQTVAGDGESTDSPGTTITIDTIPPVAGPVNAANITAALATPYTLTVTYTDSIAVQAATLGSGNLSVTSGNTALVVTFVSATPGADGPSIAATYQVMPPGGSWSSVNNGGYIVNLLGGQVQDTAGNSALAAKLGSFAVNIPAPTTPTSGAPVLAAVSDTGFSSSDGLTDLNNASPATELTFNVGGTIAGAIVTIYADGMPIGVGAAAGTSATVTTSGMNPLPGGPHNITATEQASGENVSAPSTGTPIMIDTMPPAAGPLSAPAVNMAGATSYTFTVTYGDNLGVNVASLGNANIIVTAPGNVSLAATFVSANPSTDSGSVMATYAIMPPGGSWNAADNATYAIMLQSNEVDDTAGNFAGGKTLGLFKVNIPETPTAAPGVPSLLTSTDTGSSQSDGVTNLNNSSPLDELQFVLGNTIPGATVTIYSDGTAIGSAQATSSITTVTTNGSTTIADGVHMIMARQQAPGGLLSAPSAGVPVTIDTSPPTAAAMLMNVMVSAPTYTFTVTYTDDVAVDPSTIGNGNIIVTGPNGFEMLATLVSVDNSTPGPTRTGTYMIAAAGGGWTNTDNGKYVVTLEPGQVLDTAGNAAAFGSLGVLTVNVP